MNQTILFSPVGGTDPISSSNCRDGSMLHICRVYQPSKVILYMSYEVLENQKKDNRYRYCLDRLAQLQNRTMKHEIIERPDLKEVQEFDYFYQDFRVIIEKIFQDMDETDTLLLNVSSGTPSMKSGLLVLQTLGEFPCKLIQVATPDRKMNEHIHKNYEVDVLWELNEDNAENFENRCREIHCPTLSVIKKEEIIKKHISVYDYRAALDVAETMPGQYTVGYLKLLEMAKKRVLLDFKSVDQILRQEQYDCLPVKSSDARKYFEYALTLDVKLKRGEYADFIRGITPLIVDLFEIILKKQCKINIEDYAENTKKGKVWDKQTLSGTVIEQTLKDHYKTFQYGIIYSDHLKTLIEKFSQDNRLVTIVEDLRNVEGSVRNLAAHQIVSITDETIRELTNFNGEQIMKKIKLIFSYTGIKIEKEYWNSYDDMNKKIIERMNQKKEF